ncbi:MAG: MerR family transcriptional regulator [Dermatophilaceae bacterium]
MADRDRVAAKDSSRDGPSRDGPSRDGPSRDDSVADDDPLMRIGMFSTASLVSIPALRAYHEQGLLVPDAVDPVTGYRSYRVSQLVDAQVVTRLRDLNLPLRAVAEVVRARDPEVTRRVVAEHELVMRARLADLTRVVDELHEAVSRPAFQTPVHVRDEPSRHLLAIRRQVEQPGHDGYAAFLAGAYPVLHEGSRRLGAELTGASGALYPPKVEGGPELVTAFVPIADPIVLDDDAIAAGLVNQRTAATTCAVLTHRGAYRTMGETYRQLGAWVARHARPADQPVCETYVVSVDDATGRLLPDDDLRTEIAWPIVRPERPHHPHHPDRS